MSSLLALDKFRENTPLAILFGEFKMLYLIHFLSQLALPNPNYLLMSLNPKQFKPLYVSFFPEFFNKAKL